MNLRSALIASVSVLLIGQFTIEDISAQSRKRPFNRRDREGSLKIGDTAPGFTLRKLESKKKEKVSLATFKGKQPVVLVFGSYT